MERSRTKTTKKGKQKSRSRKQDNEKSEGGTSDDGESGGDNDSDVEGITKENYNKLVKKIEELNQQVDYLHGLSNIQNRHSSSKEV